MKLLTLTDVKQAQKRIKGEIIKTPIITNAELNSLFDAEFFFKAEGFQKTGSFKARGVFNWLLSYHEKHGHFPQKVSAVSSGNHGQAVAYACSEFGVRSVIYMAKNASDLKVAMTRKYGGEVIICKERAEANECAKQTISEGYEFIHPSDDDDIIAGQGTCALEAIDEVGGFDAIFAPCGSGGLISGSFIAADGGAKIYPSEPIQANDAEKSFADGKIFVFTESPKTIADGVRSLSVSKRTFAYIRKMAGVATVSEDDIVLFTQVLMHYLKIVIEPTAAVAFAAAVKRLKDFGKKPKILVILSGANVSANSYIQIFSDDMLKGFVKVR